MSATRTHSRARGDELAPSTPLAELLSSTFEQLEQKAELTVNLLEAASPAELHHLGSRLIELLEVPSGVSARSLNLRQALVSAVMKAGFPWAMQLSPTDLPLVRSSDSGERRRVLVRRLLIVLGGLAVALSLGWQLFS